MKLRGARRFGPVAVQAPTKAPIKGPPVHNRRAARAARAASRARLAVGLTASLALLPLAWAQGSATRRRVPRLPSASPPYRGAVPGLGAPIRVLAIGESSISGVGIAAGISR
jgi:hypothetical protein